MRSARAGKERNVVRLMNQGKPNEAVAYMKRHGIIANFAGSPEGARVGVGMQEAGPQPLEETFSMIGPGDLPPLKEIPGDPNYKYPEFKAARDPVPPGVRWAKIKRELGHECQKVVSFEDDPQREVLLWIGLRDQDAAKRRFGRLIGHTLAIEPNPDERQGGWRPWVR